MTNIVDDAVTAIQKLPPHQQEALARLVLRLAGQDDEPEPIDPAHLPAVLEGLAQAERGEFATPEEVDAAFRRFVE
jgi:predicted transcriptional regulator